MQIDRETQRRDREACRSQQPPKPAARPVAFTAPKRYGGQHQHEERWHQVTQNIRAAVLRVVEPEANRGDNEYERRHPNDG